MPWCSSQPQSPPSPSDLASPVPGLSIVSDVATPCPLPSHLLQVGSTHRGVGGCEGQKKKRVRVPRLGLALVALHSKFHFCRKEKFLWVLGWVGPKRGHLPPPPPVTAPAPHNFPQCPLFVLQTSQTPPPKPQLRPVSAGRLKAFMTSLLGLHPGPVVPDTDGPPTDSRVVDLDISLSMAPSPGPRDHKSPPLTPPTHRFMLSPDLLSDAHGGPPQSRAAAPDLRLQD